MPRFELLIFSVNADFVRQATTAGADGFIVDWESRGKEERQRGADTQINHDTVEDLMRVRAATDARIIVRISQHGGETAREIEQAVNHGANEILLPMVETEEEVLRVLELARGRVAVGILIETVAAVAIAGVLGRLPLSRIYVGLNDLSIQRRTNNIFVPLVDGTLERVRRQVEVPFGFGGLTLPEKGSPIACRLLMGEMARLGTQFSFLRRSFLRDVEGQDLKRCVRAIRAGLAGAWSRGAEEVAADRESLVRDVLAGETNARARALAVT